MTESLAYLLFCVIGAGIGHLFHKKDPMTTGLGIGVGVSLAFSVLEHQPWYLSALLVFLPLLFMRRKRVRSRSTAD